MLSQLRAGDTQHRDSQWAMGRVLRIATLLAAPIVLLAIAILRPPAVVWGQQVGQPAAPVLPPLPVPPGAPVRPGALASPIGALPALAPAPVLSPSATPTPAERSFYCSCFGSGSSPHWMGQVKASGYFQARQTAVDQCLAFNFNRRPGTAFIPPARFNFFPTPAPPLASSEAEPGLPTLQAPGISGFALLKSPRSIVLQLCSTCACQ